MGILAHNCFIRKLTAKNLFHTVAVELWETVKLELSVRTEYTESRK